MKNSNARFDWWVWVGLCSLGGFLLTLYLAWGLQAGDGRLIMPLDDTYIHFQYARQLANAEPFVYNPGDAASSGATSFLYSPLLAVGYSIGFRGLTLGYWAVMLGGLCYIIVAWLIYRMVVTHKPHAKYIALLIATAFLLSGPFIWAALSGMETLLFTVIVLASLFAYQQQCWNSVLVFSAIAAMTRPEGGAIAVSVLLAVLWSQRKLHPWLVLPVLGIVVQPLANLIITGTASASGNQAKSHLYNTTISQNARIELVLENWLQMWREWLTGINTVDGRYLPTLLFLLAMGYIMISVRDAWRDRAINPTLLAFGWLLVISGGIATLETAFWHFKRYQLPLMVLFFPLGGWMLVWISERGWYRIAMAGALVIVILSSWTTLSYARRYHDNVYVVANQQIAMAEWVDDNLPDDARVGVHDVGVMRYVGNRATYDMVGLTTDGVAPAWRQGAGTIYDTMLSHPHRPDYFAVYHDIQSLPLLAEAGVFGEELQRFTVPLPTNTVASATSTQIVSRPIWPENQPMMLNVGDLVSEESFDYEWWQQNTSGGFSSVARRLPLRGCTEDCEYVVGGRIITGGESFDLPAIASDQEYLVQLRVHAATPARLFIGCNDDEQIVRVVPPMPGFLLDIPITLATTHEQFCIEVDGQYEVMGYNITAQTQRSVDAPTAIVATLIDPFEEGELFVTQAEMTYDTDVQVDVAWYYAGDIAYDGKLFVHIYDDPDRPPLLQHEQWLMGDLFPPANLPVGTFEETYTVDTNTLPTGSYVVGVGIYDPTTGKRYTVNINNETNDRLFLGTIEIN